MRKQIAAAALSVTMLFASAAPSAAAEPQAVLPAPVPEQTWRYLDGASPGENHILAYSLGHRAIGDDARKGFLSSINEQLDNGILSPSQLGQTIIQLTKLGKDPADYQKRNLISELYGYDDLYQEGLDGVQSALAAYQTASAEVPQNARNSINSVIDNLISSQLRTGGFAPSAGGDPDVVTTAHILTVLAPYQETAYVKNAVDKAVEWLTTQQNPDGSFSRGGKPDSYATAQVITALMSVDSTLINQTRFIPSGNSLSDALLRFRNDDGGYAAGYEGPSDTECTEAAVIALCTMDSGLSPYLPPTAYPGYVEPQADGKTVYLKFVMGFIGIFALIYLILISTPKIARWIDKKRGKLPEPPHPENLPSDSQTMEINIPMKAELPDFDTIHEGDIFHGEDNEKDKT